jgi:hypothetical protein
MIAALMFQNITVVPKSAYAPILISALALTIVADACLSIVAWRGGWTWRVAAFLIMLPTLFILWDFLRRAPYLF